MPLDATQQAEFDRRVSAWPSWWHSRSRRVGVALGAGAVFGALAGLSLLQSDRGFTIFPFIMVGLLDLALVVKAFFEPDRARTARSRHSVRPLS
jgi:uncharacterized membrane protein YfcA